jgi:hypothetical protein
VDAGVARAETETLLDVNRVAGQQLDAMMPLIIARAVLRRAIKAATTTAGARVVKHNNRGTGGDVAEIGFLLANLIWTAAERADTRIWSSLPAQIQVARLELPAGMHTVRFGGETRDVRIRAGRDSYAMVLRPDPSRTGAVLLDRYSASERSAP